MIFSKSCAEYPYGATSSGEIRFIELILSASSSGVNPGIVVGGELYQLIVGEPTGQPYCVEVEKIARLSSTEDCANFIGDRIFEIKNRAYVKNGRRVRSVVAAEVELHARPFLGDVAVEEQGCAPYGDKRIAVSCKATPQLFN